MWTRRIELWNGTRSDIPALKLDSRLSAALIGRGLKLINSGAATRSRSKYLVSTSTVRRRVELTSRIRNRYNERPIDLLPPSYPGVDAESDDEKIRAAIRRAEAEAALGDRGDIVDGQSSLSVMVLGRYADWSEDDLVDPNDVASDSD